MIVTAELHNWGYYTMGGKTKVFGNIHKDIQQRFPEGYWVTTSTVTAHQDDLILTRSGSVYRLVGEPVQELPPLAVAGLPAFPGASDV